MFYITAYDLRRDKIVGVLVWTALTFRAAMELCREFGGRGEFMVHGDHGPYITEVLVLY